MERERDETNERNKITRTHTTIKMEKFFISTNKRLKMRSNVYAGQTKTASVQCSHVPAIISSRNLSARNDNESMHRNGSLYTLFRPFLSPSLSRSLALSLTSLLFVFKWHNECVKFIWFALTALSIRNVFVCVCFHSERKKKMKSPSTQNMYSIAKHMSEL